MKNLAAFLLTASIFTSAFAQNGSVGIGTNTPNSAAVLDVTDTAKGLLIPRLSTAAINAIASPPNGLMLYNTTDHAFWIYESRHKYMDIISCPLVSYIGSDFAQSFTVTTAGKLQSISLSTLFYAPCDVSLRIYAGSGVNSGTLLGTTDTIVQTMSGGVHFDLSAMNIPVQAGEIFTFETVMDCGSNGNIGVGGYDCYSGGMAWELPSMLPLTEDLNFAVTVREESGWSTVITRSNANQNYSNSGLDSVVHYNGSGTLRIGDNITGVVPAFSMGDKGSFEIDAPNIPGGRLYVDDTTGNMGIGTTTPATKLQVNGAATVGNSTTAIALDAQGGIRTKHSGTYTFGAPAGLQTINIAIPAVPSGWNLTNTICLVIPSEAGYGTVHRAMLTSATNLEVIYTPITTGATRLSWIIFHL